VLKSSSGNIGLFSDEYEKMSVTYQITGESADKATILPRINPGGTSGTYYLGNAAYYIQSGATAFNYSGNADYISDTVYEDVATVDVSSTDEEFTIMFAWMPEVAYEQWEDANSVYPICELVGHLGGTLDVYWEDNGVNQYTYMKTSDEAAVSGSLDYTPYFNDCVWIALRGNDETTQVVMCDPLNMHVNGEDVIGTGATHALNGRPVTLLLGTNSDGTTGRSAFSYVRTYDRFMSNKEILDALNDVSNDIPPTRTYLRGRPNLGLRY
jgi:hypothetical protein